MLNENEVLEQSRNAMRQWQATWEHNADVNGIMYRELERTYKDLLYKGIGKTLLCIGFGSSYADNIETVKKYQDNVDIACIDKCLGSLIDNGIKPKYVFLADAGVDYEKWCKPWIDKTEGIYLLTNITANPEWIANWKGEVYFFVNKDNIQSEAIFSKISGCYELIPASSNVGNTQVVFSTQCLGYDEYLLLGYDYGWKDDDKYYAFDEGSDKRYWMKHANMVDGFGNLINTSQNLLFSAKWLSDFNTAVVQQDSRLTLTNCSGKGILNMVTAPLEKKLKDAQKRKLMPQEIEMILADTKKDLQILAGDDADANLKKALQENMVTDVIVRYIPEHVKELLEER